MKNAVDLSKNSLTTTRLGIWGIFFTMGVISMGWVPRIPEIKKALELNDAQFGILLVASSTGAGIGAQIAGRMIHTYGSKNVLRVASTVMSVALICIGISHSPLFIALSAKS
jgi:fucose permease